MSRIEEMVNNTSLLEHYKKKPEYNLVKVQALTGSNYLGYKNDSKGVGILLSRWRLLLITKLKICKMEGLNS